jgi:ABC-type phosphate transport system substrate-binding protein
MDKIRWLILSLVPLLAFAGCCSFAVAQDVVLVANKDVQVSEIKESDLRAIFMGTKTRLVDGSHIVPVTLKGGAVHEVFLKKHLAETPGDFRAEWRKAVFTGQGSMPKAFDSEAALIEYVAVTPGALGYVSRISTKDNVKAIAIIH